MKNLPRAANVVRRSRVGARSDRPAAGGPRLPPAHARRAGRRGQDQACPRGRRSPSRPLSARRPLRPARLRRLAGLPRACPRRVDPVRRRRRAQRLLGAGPAARLPQRALDVARARQLRASRRGLRVSQRGDRARPTRRAPDDLSGAAQRPERVGVRRRGPRSRGERERERLRRCACSSSGPTQVVPGLRPRRRRVLAGAPHLPARRRHAARHRARGFVGVRALLRRDRGRDRGQHRLPRHVDARRAGTTPQSASGHRPVVAPAHRRAAQRVLAVVRVPRQLRSQRRGRGHGRRPAPPLRARREVAPAPSGLRPLRAARAAAPVRGRAAAAVTRRGGGRPRAARASLRGDAPGTAGGTHGPGARGRAGRAAGRAGQPSRCGRVDPGRGRRAARRWRCSKPSTRSSGCTAGSRGPRRSSGSRARPASTPTTLEARAPSRWRRRCTGSPSAPDWGTTRRRRSSPSRCLPVLRARNMERELARCLCALGIVAVYRDVYPEAVAFLEEGAEIARATGDGLTESGGLMDLGFARLLMDDLEAAREAFEAAHVVSEELGNPILRAYATSKLGLLADAEERYGDALRLPHGSARPLRVRRRRRRTGLCAQPREPERVRAGRLLRGLAARTRRLRGLLGKQPPLGADDGALPHRLRGTRARRRRRGARALLRGARTCARLAGRLARAPRTQRDRRVPRRRCRRNRSEPQ